MKLAYKNFVISKVNISDNGTKLVKRIINVPISYINTPTPVPPSTLLQYSFILFSSFCYFAKLQLLA
jgi:hypothetical protein